MKSCPSPYLPSFLPICDSKSVKFLFCSCLNVSPSNNSLNASKSRLSIFFEIKIEVFLRIALVIHALHSPNSDEAKMLRQYPTTSILSEKLKISNTSSIWKSLDNIQYSSFERPPF
jgi:hypothetical protein